MLQQQRSENVDGDPDALVSAAPRHSPSILYSFCLSKRFYEITLVTVIYPTIALNLYPYKLVLACDLFDRITKQHQQ